MTVIAPSARRRTVTPCRLATRRDVASECLELQYALMRLARADARHRAPGVVTPAQFELLLKVRREPGVSLSDLARQIGLRPSSVSRLVEVLVGRGMVARRPGCDRRFVELHLTEEGLALLARFGAARREVLAQRLARLASDEVAGLAVALRRLRVVLASSEGEQP